jgi:hypothetical protein
MVYDHLNHATKIPSPCQTPFKFKINGAKLGLGSFMNPSQGSNDFVIGSPVLH